MALSAGDVPAMYTVLVNSLSADEATRRPAEAALAQCEARPGFCSCLLEIISARGLSCREDVRLLATVYFKNSINRYWRTRQDSYGISNEEKDHLRKNLLLNIREENNQIALQLAVLISKIARLDYPKDWRDLFSVLAQQLQSADVLASHRVFMVLFRTLKELSTKRLAVDQRNYAEITSHLFEYTWNLWKSDVQTILQNLSMLSQRNDIDTILEQSNDLILICDRWLLCLKIIRQLIVSGYASDSTTAQEVWQVREVCPTVLTAIQSLLPFYSSFKDKQAKLWEFAKRACTKLMKVLVTLQGRHPYSFVHQTVLPATVDFCLNMITNPEQAGTSFEELLIQCMILVKSVSECKEYKPSPTGRVINEIAEPLSLEQRKKNFGEVANDLLKVVLPGDRVVLLCNILIRRYFIYTAKDLEEWSESPESFHHEQNLVQWTEKQRPCVEALFIVIFEKYRELLAPVVVSILREAMSVSPPLETDVTAGMLLKDAAYTAAGHVYYELLMSKLLAMWLLLRQYLRIWEIHGWLVTYQPPCPEARHQRDLFYFPRGQGSQGGGIVRYLTEAQHQHQVQIMSNTFSYPTVYDDAGKMDGGDGALLLIVQLYSNVICFYFQLSLTRLYVSDSAVEKG